MDWYPVFEPVTRTVIVLPRCVDVSLNVDAVAPEIATPPANHWNANVVPVVHVLGFAVNVDPTTADPVIVGVATVATFNDRLEVFATLVCPDFEPVTFTEICLSF